MNTDYASYIYEKRINLGLTQKEFSELIGLKDGGERTVSGWERGEHRPSPSKLNVIQQLKTHVPFKQKNHDATFRFIDLFAGVGGIRLPFQELGGKCVFTSEWDKFAKKTYASNFGEFPHGDITQIHSSSIPEHDVLLGGFPCQAFSQAGLKQGFLDTRGTLFFEIQRILVHRRPKAFLLENVKQLKGHDKGKTLKTIIDILTGNNNSPIPEDAPISKESRLCLNHKLNYAVNFRVLKATNFGVPQNRERVYLVGFDREQFHNLDLDFELEKMFTSLETRSCNTRLGDVLEKNSDVDEKYTISDRLLAGHERRKIEHAKKGNGFGYSLFNRESRYCNTISARYYKDGSEILIDQSDIGKNPRKLIPRECARIQGFPEDFIVDAVSDNQIYKQFGNSVSVPVIRAIAQEMIQILKKE